MLAPIATILILASALIAGLLLWSSNEVDRIALERDRAIVSLVLSQAIDRVAYDQEASTVWDETVRQLAKRPLDPEWLDTNLGVWFYNYYGHNETYLLSPGDVSLYAMRDGKRVSPTAYEGIQDVAQPLVRELRSLKGAIKQSHREVAMLSPGAADLEMVRGRPAIVSAKPIVSDTGDLVQQPGTESVHVSVVFLDGAYVTRPS
jgi:sensor domain CHASE-containing protein